MSLRVQNLLPRLHAPAAWSRLRSLTAGQVARARLLARPYWEPLADWYDKREPREKLLLRALLGIAALVFAYNAVYLPLVGWRVSLRDRVNLQQHQLAEVRGMMRTYQRLRDELASTQRRTVPSGKDFSLFSVLELTLSQSVGRARIGSITPTDHAVAGGFEQYAVDVKLNQLNLSQVVDMLYSVQSLKIPVTISNLQIRQHAQGSHSYDVDLTCDALGRSG